MGRDEIQQEIDRLTKKLEEYPHGTLTYKTIKGKKQPYLQWTENGRTKSRYIKVDERTAMIGEIEERRAVGEQLHRLREYYDRIRDILAENPYLVNQRMAIGEQAYESLILSRSFYVDKTYFIPAWWERGAVHTLITRPRRFGKTLTLSMTECFFSTRYKGREELFHDLQIWRDLEYRRLQGTWPVVYLSFASVKDKDYQGAVKSISDSLAYLYRQHTDIVEGDVLSEEEKERFLQTEKSLLQQDEDVCIRALKHLSGFLNAFYKKRVIILIDEYDTPMIEGYTNGYLKEITDFMRRFFNQSLKTNPFLQKSLLTGITRIAHESLFSDMNNLQVVSYSSGYYADVFGFTEKEVFQALDCRNMDLILKREAGRMETADEKRAVKSWYDGFTFGGKTNIYNPWSITCYLNERTFQPFWVNTGGYRMISDLILNGEDEIKDDLQILIAGGSVRKTFFEQVDFQELEYDTDAVWPFLLAAGYLRADHVQILGETTADLSITNRETQLMFRHMVRKWFREAKSGREYHGFCKSLLEGDLAMMNRQMNELTLKMISFFDTGVHPSANAPERFYHGFVLGLVVDLEEDYEIISNRESGYGRYDVMMRPRHEGLDGILMEFKVFDETQEDCLEDTVRAALDQIDRKYYEETLIDAGIPKEKIRKYGFAFQGKKVLIGNIK